MGQVLSYNLCLPFRQDHIILITELFSVISKVDAEVFFSSSSVLSQLFQGPSLHINFT